jgi:hypothetical protein
MRRRAVAVLVVGVQLEEAVHVLVDHRAQLALHALAHHGALLARNGQQVGLGVGEQGAPEGDVELLARPLGLERLAIAQFEVLHAQATTEFDGRPVQGAAGLVVDRGHAAVHGKRQRYQRMAEQQAPDLGQRQHADDLVAALGQQVVAGVMEHPFEDLAPAEAMEEARLRAGEHEALPAFAIAGQTRPHADARIAEQGVLHGVHAARKPNTSSTRPQRKSPSRRSRRLSVLPRLT